MSKFYIALKGSEHNNVKVKLHNPDEWSTDGDRAVTITFPSDGMDIKLHMMESDLRSLAYQLLQNTNMELDRC